MSVILYLLGILVAAAGVAAIGFGIPINEFTLGTTLIVTGVTGLTGGLILIGLAAVVSELGRVGDALKTRPVARPAARAAEPVEAPAAAAPSMVAVPPPPAAPPRRPPPSVAGGRRPRRPASQAGCAGARGAPASIASGRPANSGQCLGVGDRAIAFGHSARRATQGRAFGRGGGRRGSVVPQRGGTSPAGRATRTENHGRGSRGRRRGRSLEGVTARFSVPLEACGTSRTFARQLRHRRFPCARSSHAGSARAHACRIRTSASPAAGASAVRCDHTGAARPADGARTGRGATYGCDPEIRRRRRHGLYALCRRIDRSQASARDGALRLDRRVAGAYRDQLVEQQTQRLKRVAPCGVRARAHIFLARSPGANASATPLMQ